jgi:peptidoglycan hydrolase-like protein with peptidoglycan-binding domain
VARVTGQKNFSRMGAGKPLGDVVASSSVTFTNNGQVLGNASSTSPMLVNDVLKKADSGACEAVITRYMARGLRNSSSDVTRLQQFLNASSGAGLPLTGTYGPLTQKFVREFQVRSGIKPSTGNVYSLTQAAINAAACGGTAPIVKPITQAGADVPSTPTKKAVKPKAAVKKSAPVAAVEKKPAPVPVVVAQPKEKKGFGSFVKSLLQ